MTHRFVLATLSIGCFAVACGPAVDPLTDTAIDLMPVLEHGSFLPAGGVSELTAEAPIGGSTPWAGEAYWAPLPILPEEGWGRANQLGWRPQGERSTLRLWRPELWPPERQAEGSGQHHGGAELFFILRQRLAPGTARPPEARRIDVSWNGTALGQVEMTAGLAEGRLAVAGDQLAEVNQVELRYDPPIRQNATGAQEIALQRFGLVAGNGALPPMGARVDRQRGLLQVSGTGHYTTPLDLPRDVRELRFDLRWRQPSGRMRWLAVTPDGERHELFAHAGSAGSEWEAAQAPLEGVAGQDVFLVLEVVDAAGVEVRAPRLTRSSAPVFTGEATAERGSAAPGPATGEPVTARARPDIFLILLDAARGDRFANPDYPRRTNPNIDRMAEDALVFRRAYSECPTTSCSVPNMVTGLPFLAAGLGRGGWLDDGVVTLAESLQSLGYRTVGFSANPNNSASRNLHQGFDEFYRLWGRHQDHGPYGMSRRAAEVIAGQPAHQPLFLQLHYLPPHEPYGPPPAFDVYSDPEYRGPIAPRTSPGPYRQSRAALSDADVRRFIDLYDGNLLWVDDAVGRVFAALEAAGRWDDSLVLLTSDHGEAFWEHGEQGHNSTLFDEMLHIPFILRLPGGQRPAHVDTDRLASLGDVVPTLLSYLGLEPAPGVAGLDLLGAPPDLRQPRRIFHRTNNPKLPLTSVRTPRFKAIVKPRFQQQWLFDLTLDPQEKNNLVGERPLLFTGLGLLMRQHLTRAAASEIEAAEVSLSEEEQEVLRSLGYL